jgi:DeoR/GlpR family transcriptional regulator of sugar metabolism
VPDGATVVLDSGTTALALARLLAGRPLRAVALDLPVAQALAQGETEVLSERVLQPGGPLGGGGAGAGAGRPLLPGGGRL